MAVDPEDEFGTLVAADDDEINPSAELDAIESSLSDPTLFGDDLAQDDVVVETQPQVYSLGRSWQFDFNARRFVRGRARSPLPITGVAQLRQWIEKTLYTERGALPIHSDDYGLEGADALIGQPFTSGASALLRIRVEEAMLFHPKIIGVENFDAQVSHDDDETIMVSFTVQLDNGDLVAFDTRLQ